MKSTLRLIFCVIFLSISIDVSSQIVINEVVSGNTSINTDEDGTFQDWVELYNNGPASVNLSGYGITDDSLTPYKWVFPNVTVPSGGYLLVWCSDKNRAIAGQPLHTNWKIGGSGEVITLTAPGNLTVDAAPATVIPTNQSLARQPNGTGSFNVIATVTPAAQNPAAGTGGQLDAPVFSQASGFFTSGFTLTLSSTEPGATILYTLDGSEPSAANLGGTTYNYKNQYPENSGQAFGPMLFKSFQTNSYSAPLSIADRTTQNNKISMISSTYDFSPDYFPGVKIYKATVVRAKVVKAGYADSDIVTKNYFVTPSGNSRFTLPVVSLSIDENKLFDYEDGIYVAGKLFDDWRTANPSEEADYPIGNYTQKGSTFERVANFNYFVNGTEVINQQIGIRVQGNYSRLYPSKSLNFYSSGMPYQFFPDEPYTNFKNVVMKNSGSDFYNSFFKDALCAELAKPLHTQTEASQPAVTFINGEYWGLLTMRERYDDEFFLRVHNIPKTQIELLENDGYQIEEGDNAHYLAMINYIETHSLATQANYDYIRTQMDTESFIDYFVTNIFMENEDWPGNNIVFWRKNTAYDPTAPYGSDGRWRWAVHDMSSSWYDYQANTLAVATDATSNDFPNPQWSTLILRKLLQNASFKNDFISRFADIMNSAFIPSRSVAIINAMKNEIQPEMAEQIVRWKAPFEMAEWNYFVGERLDFANNRPTYQRSHIRSKFGITGNINVTVNVSNPAHGLVKVNTIEIAGTTAGISANPYPWTGIYFANIPVKLKAIAKPGYIFSHWTGASSATTDEITITSSSAFSCTAVFVPASFSAEVSVPINFWYMSGAIPNNLPLTNLSSSYEAASDGVIDFQSALAGYPFTSADPNWRMASMERRNKPTPLNYRPEANGGAPYLASDMKAIQITQPFQDAGLQNTMIFNLSTKDYKNIKFSFAAMDEGAATGITIEYSVAAGEPVWTTTGLATTSFALVTDSYQLYESDFTSIASVNDNPNFKIRLRFTGPNMTASAGDRVTFNNIALDGVKLPLIYNSPNVYTTGSAISPLTPTVAASVSNYSVSPALPTGLSLNATTGVISGTPTVVTPTATYTVTATNAGGTATFGVVITVNAPVLPPSALSYSSPNVFTKGTAISPLNPTVTGTVTTYSVSPALPAGLSIDVATGVISGTPSAVTATSTYTVTATNSSGNTSFGISITVNDIAPSGLSYNTPNVFTVGSAIAALNPTVSGSVSNYSISPALPLGLSIDVSTGVISGTPSAVTATSIYTVTATNSGGNTSFGISITVNDAAPSGLSYNTPNVFTIGSTITALSPTVSGNVSNYSVSPTLPTGLSIDVATGVISGMPSAISATSIYTVTASNSGGNTTFDISITVNDAAPSGLSYSTPNVFTVGSPIIALNPTVSGNVSNYSVSPALPLGLSIDAATGVISGTPSAVTTTSIYTVTASNSGGNTSFGISITVNDAAPSGLSYNTPNVFTIGSPINALNPTVSGSVSNYSVSPALPVGLSIDATTGVISGTPSAISTTAIYTVTATNSGGNVSFGISITVNDSAPSGLSYNTPNVFIVGSAIAALSPTISGSVSNYSVSPALPAGLSIDAATGVISGTPSAISATSIYTVTASNSGGNETFDISITVNDAAPSGLSYNTPNVFTLGSPIIALNPTVSGSVSNYSVSPALPAGLSIDAVTGVISGTPSAVSATLNYTVTASNSGGNTSFGISITINEIAPSGLSYNTPNVFTVGSSIIALNPTVSGSASNYSVSPALPAGLSINATTGVISGTPSVISTTAIYTVTATNSGGNTSFGISITINDAAPSGLSYNTPNVFTVGSAIAALSPTISGSVSNYSISPGLPAGLSIDAATGVISGTPTVISPTAIYTVTATNSGGNTTFDISITVNDAAPSGLSYNTPNVFTVGSAIAALNPTISGSVSNYSVSPALPAGLSIDAATGVISGTPSVISITAIYTVTATNSAGNTSFGISITVKDVAPSGLSYNTPNVFTVGSAITALNPTVSGSVSNYSVSPALPAGLSIDAVTGVISGTPSIVSATAIYTVTASNSGGNVSFGISITVNDAAPSGLSYNTPNVFTVGSAITALNPTVSGNVSSYSVSPALPTGLSIDATTGVISGTPSAISTTAIYTVTATNSGGNISFGISITINDNAPSGLSYSTPNVFTVGSAIAALNPTISGSVSNYSVSPALPAGLSIDAATGVISGTPSAISATSIYTVTASNSGGNETFDISITVNDAAPSGLSYNTPNVFTLGSPIIALNPTVSGSVSNYSVSPALPAGLSIDAVTGVISGTPSAVSATLNYTVTASNSGGNTSFGISITINEIAPSGLSYNTPNVFIVGSSIIALNPTVSGSASNYSVSPALPSGLSIDAATGVISGTPTVISTTAVYTVTATNSGGNTTFDISITVNDAAPSGLSYNTPNVFTVGSAIIALNPTVSGSVSNYSVAPALPAGLSIDAVAGEISGSPTMTSTTAIYTVTATNSGGNTTFDISITVNDAAPSGLSYNTPNVITVGSAIAALSPTVSGSVSNYSVSPALPAGLSIDAATGVISGTPTVISTTAIYTVTATNSGGNTTFDISITVNDAAPSGLSYNTPNVFTVGSTIATLNPTVSGSVSNYSVSPALPAGLSIDGTTGVISGTPSAISATSIYTVTASNSGGNSSFGISITVNDVAPSGLSYNTPNVFTVGSAIAALSPTISGIVSNFSVSPALPAGLSIDAATGVISGTPSAISETSIYTVTATNSGGNTTFDISITVNDNAPSGLSYSTPNVFTIGSSIIALNPTVSGSVSNYSVSPALPLGLSIDATTGVISGTPSVISTTAIYTVTASNSGGNTTFGISITVNDAAPSGLSYNTPNVFTVGSAITALNPTVSGNVSNYSVSSALPAGLSIDATSGVISGTPSAVSATSIYSVTASNSGGNVSFGISITVNDAAPSGLSYNTPNVFTVGSPIIALNPTVSGSVSNYSVSPALPAGLSIDAATGVISGTPSAVTATSIYTVTASNSGENTTFDISITVNDAAPSGLSYNTPNVFTVGSTIASLNPTVSGSVSNYSVSPALPAGLSIDATTGVISGTPSAISTTSIYTVTATNSGGNMSFGISITVNDIAPSGLSYNTPNVFTIGSAIAALNPTVSGVVSNYSVSPALPSGLSIDATTGVISGTPSAISTTSIYTVTASNSGGNTTFDISITVNDAAPNGLSYNTPNVFTIGSTITALSPTVSGSVSNYSVSPALPSGLSIDAVTGVISGTPSAVTTTSIYSVTASNSGGNTTFDISITVNNAAPSGLSYNTPNVFTVGSAIAALNPTVSGNVSNYSVSPALPAGLSIDAATGVISGTPSVISTTAVYTVTATNSGGNMSFGISITVNDIAPSGLSYNTPNVFTVGSPIIALNPTVSGSVSNYSVSPALPAGLSIDAATGVISGTPTVISTTAIYTVTATNSGGNMSFGISITVNDVAPSGLSYNTPNVFTVGSVIAALSPTISGNVSNYSVAPALPLGLSIDATTGVISGTPSAISTTAIYTVTAANSGGSVSFGVEITINPGAPSALSYTNPNVFTIGSVIASLSPAVNGDQLTFSIDPALPSGLAFDPGSGVISGTPGAISPATTYTVTASNSGGSVSFELVISVIDAAPGGLSYPSPNTFNAGVTIVPLSPTVTGQNMTYSVSPELPDGLVLDPATGIISGTPSILTPTATHTVTATNSGGSVSFGVVITVVDAAPLALSYPSPNTFTADITIAPLSPTATGHNISYDVSPNLPSGLILDPATGIISGTPSILTPTATYTVTATNSGGSVSFGVVITIIDAAPSGLSYPSPNNFTTGVEIAPISPVITGNNVAYSVSPDLPAGLVFDPATGIISGTPTIATATAAYIVTATNSGGSVWFEVVITVNDPLGMGNNPRFDFGVWPNPFVDVVNLSGISGEVAYKLFTIDGKLIENGKVNQPQLRFGNLPEGVYLLQLEQDGGLAIKKIIRKD